MKEELRKSLTDLIDETLLELEELKKSRFAASEIEIKGPGEGIAGKPSNGDLHAKKAEDDKDEEKKKKDEEAKKAEEAMKAEGHNRQADPNGGHHQMDKAEGHNRQADPNGGHHKMDKAEDKPEDKKDDKKKDKDGDDDKDDKKMAFMKKSLEDSEALLKSFVDERVKPLEDKLSTILDMVNKIADAPVPAKGTTSGAQPLKKSADDSESLSKSDVASKLFELKKSGTKVDSLDITRAEMGQDLQKIVAKYKIS